MIVVSAAVVALVAAALIGWWATGRTSSTDDAVDAYFSGLPRSEACAAATSYVIPAEAVDPPGELTAADQARVKRVLVDALDRVDVDASGWTLEQAWQFLRAAQENCPYS